MFVDVSRQSGIDFSNNLTYTEEFNPYTYRNFYNGAGVALADINNDGWLDVYLTGNVVGNKLYLNMGDWKFKDITDLAGVACPNVWSSGATFADVNNDGFLDLYVCKSGKPGGKNRHNELFINNGDNTFSEKSKEYGLDIEGLSTHAAFFDFDKDGDLDVYVLTNSAKPIGLGFDLKEGQREIPDPNNEGNRFLVNRGGHFEESTQESGIYSSSIGFGLGITLEDFNNDSWVDIFISNDFFERDYLYLNNQSGGFIEVADSYFSSMSMGSMGADAADLNNDGKPDLFVTEMLPRELPRQRSKTMFESWDKYQVNVGKGYFHQFSRNVLQQNIGGHFSEISRFSEMSATEWSWGALMADFNNDGSKDVFVSNGIYKDLLDRDYLAFMANEEQIRAKIRREEPNLITELVDAIPSSPVSNVMFENRGEGLFQEVAGDWGLNEPSFSNGSAYGDLDNDGDLDLIVNNVNMPTAVYRNNGDTSVARSLRFRLIGITNTMGVGAKVEVWANGESFSVSNFPSRGFQSSMDPIVHVGLGKINYVDSLKVYWPEGGVSILGRQQTNQLIEIYEKDKLRNATTSVKHSVNNVKGHSTQIDFVHEENRFVDFDRERLLFQMYSNEGPKISRTYADNPGLEEFYIGGAKGQMGGWVFPTKQGVSVKRSLVLDSLSEDLESVFFDCDNDGDLDLYVASGGRAFSKTSSLLEDRLYINENGSLFLDKNRLLPNSNFSSSGVDVGDIDSDGDLDLFVGERFHPSYYGQEGGGHILLNDGQGFFTDVTKEKSAQMAEAGMITDGEWIDVDNDNDLDLVTVGDWCPIQLWINENGSFKERGADFGLDGTRGWWNTIETVDLDRNGDLDLVVGNHGLNSFFKKGTVMFIADFDSNGSKEHIVCHLIDGEYYPIADRDELVSQIPSLKKKILYFKDYADMTIRDLFEEGQLEEAEMLSTDMMESSIFYNTGGKFLRKDLPKEAQYTPLYAIKSFDVNRDGYPDLILGGNQYLVKPQFGRFDGLRGLIFFGSKNGFSSEKCQFLNVVGQVRDIEVVELDNKTILLFAINNAPAQTYEIEFD